MGHVHLLQTLAHRPTGTQAHRPTGPSAKCRKNRNTQNAKQYATQYALLQALCRHDAATLHDPRAERWPCCCASAARYGHHASHATPQAQTPTHDPSIAQLVERWTVGGWRGTRRAGIHRSLVQIRLEGVALFFDRLAFVVLPAAADTSDLTAARCSQNEKESFRYRESNPSLLGESQKS